MTAHAATRHPDADLLALGIEFRKAWAAERAAYVDPRSMTDQDTGALEAAYMACSDLAHKIIERTPATLDGVKVVAMCWGWLHYLSEKPGEYEGADEGSHFEERIHHTVMSFLLKDVAA